MAARARDREQLGQGMREAEQALAVALPKPIVGSSSRPLLHFLAGSSWHRPGDKHLPETVSLSSPRNAEIDEGIGPQQERRKDCACQTQLRVLRRRPSRLTGMTWLVGSKVPDISCSLAFMFAAFLQGCVPGPAGQGGVRGVDLEDEAQQILRKDAEAFQQQDRCVAPECGLGKLCRCVQLNEAVTECKKTRLCWGANR
eukprot:1159720-Pelagomonas_calceolata.AAC.15